jgi:hypothetical protein
MDYLPIQATSVPCERVFSSAKETDTAKRNKLDPILMEILQMLKFSLKKEHLNFMAGWSTSEAALSDVSTVPDLNSLFVGDAEAVIDDILNKFTDQDRENNLEDN